jgi:hypothetical protein
VSLAATGLAFAGILALGMGTAAGAESSTTEPTTATTAAPAPVVASSSSVSLTLFGAPLVVDIKLDPGGNLVDVALNQPGDFTATKVKPNKVVFVNEAQGVSVKVKAKHGGERVEARATDLADVSGANRWSGDVFENGQASVVNFTVGAATDGSPDITGVAVTSPFQFTVGTTEHKAGDEHAFASVVVKFTNAGQSRTLRITVASRTGDDHTSAKLSIALSRLKGAAIPDGEAVGAHTWSGMLCNGTTATINYTVQADGSLSGVTASPDGATISAEGKSAKVRFATGERVSIKVRDKDGQLQVGVTNRIRCAAAKPTVNTPVQPGADSGKGGHGHDGGGDHSHDRGGN